MDFKKKGFWTGAAVAFTGIEIYWITQAMKYSDRECAFAAVVIAGLVSLCIEVIWEREQEKRRKRSTKRAIKKAIERFMEQTERDYLVIPRRDDGEKTHMHHRWEVEDDPEEREEQKEPIREVKGALAEDFAMAPESVRREIFG